ncbi:MAG: VOC family protein [Candidatus Marinimicrobia bacterium]|jgi:hypothetical protein|nr:VOC family protein [Candidatus Neomarinimicrobiota bacterium]
MDIVWFEIPVRNLEKSIEFYESVLKLKLEPMSVGNEKMGVFPFKTLRGALIEEQNVTPSQSSTIVYFDGGSDLNFYLERAEQFGGKILQHKTKIPDEKGYYGIFSDLDGNAVGLHHT